MYPVLEINLKKIRNNAEIIKGVCSKSGIAVVGVVKGAEALLPVAAAFLEGGIACLADSRMNHILSMRRGGLTAEILLLRIPMISELDNLVCNVDMSLNSEISVLQKIEEACERNDKSHGVILMADLGDLREGYFDEEELLEAASFVENNLKRVRLKGIGTNLGCYGSVAPTTENLSRLIELAERIEEKIGRRLEIISGGATSSLKPLVEGEMPERINQLRIGEGILSARDMEEYFDCRIDGLEKEAFVLKAEVVEVKTKPTYPVGDMMVNAFGEKPVFEDKGKRKRALLAVGRGDFGQPDKLIPKLEGAFVLGASSDHLILDIEDCTIDVKVGDILDFGMYYGPMLFLCGSDSVKKCFYQ
jgi:predicted amino acid racemase